MNVSGLSTNWSNTALGKFHTIALKTNGTLWAWGYNGYNDVSASSTVNCLTPIQIKLPLGA